MNIADFLPKQFMSENWQSMFDGKFSELEIRQEKCENVSYADYLQRGETITTCARVKKSRRFVSSVEKVLASNAIRQRKGYEKIRYARNRLMSEIIRPACEQIVEKYEAGGVFAPSAFLNLFEPEVDLKMELAEPGSDGDVIVREMCRRKASTVYVVNVSTRDMEVRSCPLNAKLTERKNGSQYYLRTRGKSSTTTVGDIGLCCTKYFELSLVLRYLKGISEEEREEDRLWSFLFQKAREILQQYQTGGVVKVSTASLNGSLGAFLKKVSIPYCKCADKEKQCIRTGDTAVFDFIALKPNLEKTYAERILDALFDLLIEEAEKDADSEKFHKELSSKATVWMTKKNIPEKMVKAMVESSFNDYFGYVEFDEECDINALKEIEQEWKALQHILKGKRYEDIALRFRKLGNHHASGLYFPNIRCLCVDIRTPSSMIHEYFHLLDFEGGELSRKESFRKCEYLYKESVLSHIDALDKDDPVKVRWKGNTKYNRYYYFEPTEIFARCGEIYMVQVLGIDNSLCRPESGFAYPQDSVLVNAIKMYFDHLFGIKSEEEMKKILG